MGQPTLAWVTFTLPPMPIHPSGLNHFERRKLKAMLRLGRIQPPSDTENTLFA